VLHLLLKLLLLVTANRVLRDPLLLRLSARVGKGWLHVLLSLVELVLLSQ
jgi:hypothetical protein